MASPSRKASMQGLRPLCLPALVEERTRGTPVVTSKVFSLHHDSVLWSISSKGSHVPLPALQSSTAAHPPAIIIDSPPSSPSFLSSPISQSPPDSPLLRTPRIGSGIVYFSPKNPAPWRPVSDPTPRLASNSYAPRCLDTLLPSASSLSIDSVITALSCYSKESAVSLVSLHDEQPTDRALECASPSTVQSPAMVPLTPELVTDDSEVHTMQLPGCNDSRDITNGWVDFPSYGLGHTFGAEWAAEQSAEQISLSVAQVPSPRRPHRLKSRMKTIFKKLSASIKLKRHPQPSSPLISSPELLDLPGYNRSVALGLSSPIQVARFLQSSEETHSKRHKANNFPRSLQIGRRDSPSIQYTQQTTTGGMSYPELNNTLFSSQLSFQHLSSTSPQHQYPNVGTFHSLDRPADFALGAYTNKTIEEFERRHSYTNSVESLELPLSCHTRRALERPYAYSQPSSPKSDSSLHVSHNCYKPSLHPDIMNVLTTLGSSSPFIAPSRHSNPRPYSGNTMEHTVPTYFSESPLPFDPALMPFAAKWFKKKSYARLTASICIEPVRLPNGGIYAHIPVNVEPVNDSFLHFQPHPTDDTSRPTLGPHLGHLSSDAAIRSHASDEEHPESGNPMVTENSHDLVVLRNDVMNSCHGL